MINFLWIVALVAFAAALFCGIKRECYQDQRKSVELVEITSLITSVVFFATYLMLVGFKPILHYIMPMMPALSAVFGGMFVLGFMIFLVTAAIDAKLNKKIFERLSRISFELAGAGIILVFCSWGLVGLLYFNKWIWSIVPVLGG